MKRGALLLLATLTIAGLCVASAAVAATLNVCPSGCTYATIQGAINAASPGDTVAVGPGTYVENVVIDRSLTLQGVRKGHGTGRRKGRVTARLSFRPSRTQTHAPDRLSAVVLRATLSSFRPTTSRSIGSSSTATTRA